MSEEGFFFFEIQTPWKIQPSTNQKVPRNPANFETPSLFFRPKMANPSTLGGGGGGRSYGRLGLPSISATRKVKENTKK